VACAGAHVQFKLDGGMNSGGAERPQGRAGVGLPGWTTLRRWEIDVFHGDNDGLIVAEIELSRESETFEHPPWLGKEVSDDYFNSNLLD